MPVSNDFTSFRTDPESVRTDQLAAVIREWAKEHENDGGLFEKSKSKGWTNATLGTGRTSEGYGPRMGATDYIGTWSGIPDRRVRSILAGESTFTSLRVADAILTAIRENGALTDGRVNVVPNPGWSLERWTEWMSSRGCVGIAA